MMMSPSTLFSFLFTISLLLISVHADAAAAPARAPSPEQKLYVLACNRDAHCMKVLGSDPHIVAAKDWATLCRLVLKTAIKRAIKGQIYLQGLISKYPSSKAIKLCATQEYTYSVESFSSSLGELKEDPLTANYDAKVAGDGPFSCQGELDKEKLVIPAVNIINREIMFWSNVAFVATNHL